MDSVLFTIPSSFSLCLGNQCALFKIIGTGSCNGVCETRTRSWREETEDRAVTRRSRGPEGISGLGRVTRKGV